MAGFNFNPFKKEQSLDELSEEAEKEDLQYTIEQRKAAIRELKKRGVSPSAFSSFGSILKWLKTH